MLPRCYPCYSLAGCCRRQNAKPLSKPRVSHPDPPRGTLGPELAFVTELNSEKCVSYGAPSATLRLGCTIVHALTIGAHSSTPAAGPPVNVSTKVPALRLGGGITIGGVVVCVAAGGSGGFGRRSNRGKPLRTCVWVVIP